MRAESRKMCGLKFNNKWWQQSRYLVTYGQTKDRFISREADNLHSFRHKLKTHLFTLCFND